MGYCKRCFEHISNDCILDSGVCVFCYYKSKTWDSNGKIIHKKGAIQDWGKSFLVWRNYYLNYYKDIKKAIKNSPKGTFQKRKIKGHLYYYLVYREGEKIKFKYYGKQIAKDLQEKINLRKELIKKLTKIRSLLYSLRITPRPTKKLNNYTIFERDKFTC